MTSERGFETESSVHEALLEAIMSDRALCHLDFDSLDRLIGGIRPDRVNLISGDPACGKSTLLGQLCDDMASKGCSVVLHTHELAKSCFLGKSLARLSDGRFTLNEISDPAHEEQVREVADLYKATRGENVVFLDDGYSIEDLGVVVGSLAKERPESPLVVMIDYIQIARPGSGFDRADERISIRENLDGLRKIARTYRASVWAISAVNRANYDKSKPTLNSFAGAASLEYGCDLAVHISLDRSSKDYSENAALRPVTLTILKNRYGSKGEVNLTYDTEHALFAESD